MCSLSGPFISMTQVKTGSCSMSVQPSGGCSSHSRSSLCGTGARMGKGTCEMLSDAGSCFTYPHSRPHPCLYAPHGHGGGGPGAHLAPLLAASSRQANGWTTEMCSRRSLHKRSASGGFGVAARSGSPWLDRFLIRHVSAKPGSGSGLFSDSGGHRHAEGVTMDKVPETWNKFLIAAADLFSSAHSRCACFCVA